MIELQTSVKQDDTTRTRTPVLTSLLPAIRQRVIKMFIRITGYTMLF